MISVKYPIKNMLKKYDDVNVSKWTFEVEPFVMWWTVQTKKDMRCLEW